MRVREGKMLVLLSPLLSFRFQCMFVHKIKECSKDTIFTATGKLFQVHKPNNSRFPPRENIFTGVERHFRNNVSIKPNGDKKLAKIEVDWIRTTTTETRNVYMFGEIVILAGQRCHNVKKLKRKNKKPRKLNTYALRLQELKNGNASAR